MRCLPLLMAALLAVFTTQCNLATRLGINKKQSVEVPPEAPRPVPPPSQEEISYETTTEIDFNRLEAMRANIAKSLTPEMLKTLQDHANGLWALDRANTDTDRQCRLLFHFDAGALQYRQVLLCGVGASDYDLQFEMGFVSEIKPRGSNTFFELQPYVTSCVSSADNKTINGTRYGFLKYVVVTEKSYQFEPRQGQLGLYRHKKSYSVFHAAVFPSLNSNNCQDILDYPDESGPDYLINKIACKLIQAPIRDLLAARDDSACVIADKVPKSISIRSANIRAIKL